MRVNHVKKSQKDQGACESCGQPIPKGSAYKSISPRYGGKRKRHEDCPSWRPSEMTTAKVSTAYAAQEGGHDDLDGLEAPTNHDEATELIDTIKAILAAVSEGANECAADYQDGYDNMPENFQAGPTGEEILEKVDMLESWANDLEGWEPDTALPAATDDTEAYEGDENAALWDEDAWVSWFTDVVQEASDVIDALEM